MALASCSNEDIQPNIENQILFEQEIESILKKHGFENYIISNKNVGAEYFVKYSITELDSILNSITEYRNSNVYKSIKANNSRRKKTLKSNDNFRQLLIHGSSYFYPSEVIHFEALVEYFNNGYWGVWNVNDLTARSTGLFPCSLTYVTNKLISSYQGNLEVQSSFVLEWGIDIDGIPLYISERMEAVLHIDTYNLTMNVDLIYLND